jgi:[lysine-biosynthesis-protein LysW]--L-2-aminoadipate ligase
MPSVGMVYTRMRAEEQALLEAGRRLGIQVVAQHDERIVLGMDGGIEGDAVLIRSLGANRALMLARALSAWDRPAINNPHTIITCMDKAETSLRLHRAGVATPESRVAFTPEQALEALDALGYPAVLKPVQGSWARMVAKVRDRQEAAQILEHRAMLPNPNQHLYYMQRFIETFDGERHSDVRAVVVGDDLIAAIRRVSANWPTNTARGATTENQPLSPELEEICLRAAEAVGGGILALDLLRGPDGWMVHEVNHNLDFRNTIAPTGVDIPGRILQHVQQEARR